MIFYRTAQFDESCETLHCKIVVMHIMVSLTKILLLVTILWNLLITASSQKLCISEHLLVKENTVFTSDFQGINKNFGKVDKESKCVHFLGLPNMEACSEIGLRYKHNSNDVNSSISLCYYSNKHREIQYEIIDTNRDMDDKYGWNHWSKIICADFEYGVSIVEEKTIIFHSSRNVIQNK